jgi:hypothetical protein
MQKKLHAKLPRIPGNTVVNKKVENSAAAEMSVNIADVKPWKDSHEHEKVARQRQDLFDPWEQGTRIDSAIFPYKTEKLNGRVE